MTKTNRNPTLQAQTYNQLKLALAAGDLDGDERRQILDELERRRRERDRQTKTGQQAVEAALSDMSHAELLAWTPSLIDEEDRAVAKELRARIKALENKLAEVQHRELKPVADVDHPHIRVE